jgi:hypothetical protein
MAGVNLRCNNHHIYLPIHYWLNILRVLIDFWIYFTFLTKFVFFCVRKFDFFEYFVEAAAGKRI